ncbi:MAG: helix-turn-helix domain-containing protein [Deltaproteobacteria bacterium]|nr:helix-turn-helix domain-containing protein [Deltaproteobacteria bacterium]
MARKKINETTKQKVIEAHASGLPMRKIAKECGVSLSSVHRIVKEKAPQKVKKEMIKKEGKAERQKRIEELERRIVELEKKILDLDARKSSWRK